MSASTATRTPNPPKRRRSVGQRLAIIIPLAVLLTFGLPMLLRRFVVEVFRIPAASMSPTLLVGDHFFVTKLGYRPARGDVVVFKFPAGQPGDPPKDFVKRLVALAGDRIAVKHGRVVLNGQPLPRDPVAGPCQVDDVVEDEGQVKVKRVPCAAFTESLDGHRYTVIHTQFDVDGDGDMAERAVPAGHGFVLGDNRDNSRDRRFWGFVPYENIKGQAQRIWYSAGKNGVRSERLLTKVP